MIKRSQVKDAQVRAAAMLDAAGIRMTDAERAGIEVADLGLDDFERQGLALITYVNTSRYCAKEIVMFPRQTCPQHRHPPVTPEMTDADPPPPPQGDPGKMETFRCRFGELLLYVEGPAPKQIKAVVPEASKDHYTVFHEVVLRPGQMYTIPPNTWHWFQAGDEGCIVSEFSSTSRDPLDDFLDPNVQRLPQVEED